MMGKGIGLAALLGLFLCTSASASDDASSCAEGITMIQDALALNPPDGSVRKLERALRDAKREQLEGEFGECLDAVSDARKVIGP